MPPLRFPPKRTDKNKPKPLRIPTNNILPQNPAKHSLVKSLSIPTYSLPSRDLDNILLALDKCYAPSTQKSHTRAIQHFSQFCDEREVPPNLRFPAHEIVLLAYAASHIGFFSGGTTRHRISALKAYHDLHNLPWHGSTRLTKIIHGVTHHAPASTSRPPRSPVTTTMLKHLLNNLDLNVPLDACVAACACTAFWGQCRLGELLPTSSSINTPSPLIPSRSHLTRSASRRANTHAYELILPSTKTNRRGQTITILKQNHSTDPLPLLQHHLAINNLPPSSHLFSYTSSSHSEPISLSKRRFLARCNTIWSSLGYPRLTGHCFRIGGTSKLLASGVPPDVVKAMGRWSSDSFLRYWRHLDKIAPAQTPCHTRHKPRSSL